MTEVGDFSSLLGKERKTIIGMFKAQNYKCLGRMRLCMQDAQYKHGKESTKK